MQDGQTSLEWYAKRILPEAQIRKFRYRQDLLSQELENESRFPEVQNVLSDIFTAVKEKNYQKYLIAHRQLNGRIDEETLRQAVRYSIISKAWEKKDGQETQKRAVLTKREAFVLSRLQEGKSLMEVF